MLRNLINRSELIESHWKYPQGDLCLSSKQYIRLHIYMPDQHLSDYYVNWPLTWSDSWHTHTHQHTRTHTDTDINTRTDVITIPKSEIPSGSFSPHVFLINIYNYVCIYETPWDIDIQVTSFLPIQLSCSHLPELFQFLETQHNFKSFFQHFCTRIQIVENFSYFRNACKYLRVLEIHRGKFDYHRVENPWRNVFDTQITGKFFCCSNFQFCLRN